MLSGSREGLFGRDPNNQLSRPNREFVDIS